MWCLSDSTVSLYSDSRFLSILADSHLVLPPFLSFAVAASTPNSTAGAAMNSLTSLGTLQGLAGATVGLNNINALAGTVNSEYLLLWWTAFP